MNAVWFGIGFFIGLLLMAYATRQERREMIEKLKRLEEKKDDQDKHQHQ